MSCNFEILNNIQQHFCLPEIGLIWGNGFWGIKPFQAAATTTCVEV